MKVKDIAGINLKTINKKYKGQIQYLDTSSVTDNHFEGYRTYGNMQSAPSRARRIANIGDTVISTVRPNQKHNGFIDIQPDNAIYSTGFTIVSPNTDRINPYYLYLFLSSEKVTEFLQQIGETSTSAYPSVKPSDIGNLDIALPSRDVQDKISKEIYLLDSKIKLNNKINDNLKLTLTTIFKSQINSFGFDEANLTDIATYKNGLAMQKYRPKPNEQSLPVLKIKELNQGYTDTSSDRCSAKIDEDVTVHTGDIIFSWSGTLLVKNWSGKTAGLNQHLFKVTSKNYPDWFIYEWTKHHLRKFQSIAAGKATTMGHIKRSDLASSRVIIPDKNSLAKLDAIMKPLYDKRIEIIKENQRLIEIKEMLLQKYF